MKKNIRLRIEEELLSVIKAEAFEDKYGRDYIDLIHEALYDLFVAGNMEVIMKKNIRLFIEDILRTIEVYNDWDKAAAFEDKYGRDYIDMIREALYELCAG